MNLKEAGLGLTEQAYRDLPLLSYSALSRFDREGYDCVNTLFDPISSPSLTFGSLVDCLLTQGEEAFNEQYAVMDSELPPESITSIVQCLAAGNSVKNLIEVSDDDIVAVANTMNYQKNWKDATRVAKIRELGTAYFRFLQMSEGKIIVSADDVSSARNAAEALKTDPKTAMYFNESTFGNVDHLYQLQLKAHDFVSDLDYKVMLDLVIVDHDNKIIIPCDLKTTRNIYTFEDSFYKYRYYIQASMYTCALRDTIVEKCPEISTYKIQPYRFIAIDRTIYQPVVFEWEPIENVRDPYDQIRTNWRDLLGDLHWALQHLDKRLPKKWAEEMENNSVIKLTNYNVKKCLES